MTKKKSFLGLLGIFALALIIGLASYQPSEASSQKSSGHGSSKGESKGHAKPHWSYEGKYGPSQWGSMLAEYSACGKGKRQSPIDITGITEAELTPLKFRYRNSKNLTILNNGHAIQVNQRKSSLLYLDGTEFDLLQVHFHSPSEHTIDGKSSPMEAHFVHADKEGNLAVVGVMIKVGSHNTTLDDIWPVMPKVKGKKKLAISYDIDELLPTDKSYYRYAGSLTTPPCTESVIWLVLKSPIEISKDQLKTYRAILNDTNRPIQERNNRLVLD
ncbi:Carbonic anhydrase, alpha class [hydrothermal vent metagenome]|uniref:carbonic anhydrase n=1 Tax=hydrothermal vent metagenome TaxID=652676 RepID=A0A3B0V742_9ZZZZ